MIDTLYGYTAPAARPPSQDSFTTVTTVQVRLTTVSLTTVNRALTNVNRALTNVNRSTAYAARLSKCLPQRKPKH